MKTVLTFFVMATLLFGNEVERIESIVNDVTKLRQNYETCKTELASLDTRNGSTRDEKVVVLQQEIASQRDLYEREIERMKRELSASEKKLALLTRSLNDTKVNNAEQKSNTRKEALLQSGRQKSTELKKVYVANEPKPCTDTNPFPKLLMKTEYRAMRANGTLKDTESKTVSRFEADEVTSTKTEKVSVESIFFKPRPFRMKHTAKIYNAPNGEVIATWEAGISFTSGEKQGSWIKISGYFIDQKWRPNRENEMWVEEKNTIIR